MTSNQLPSVEYLRRTFEYCPETGILRWRYRDDVNKSTNSRFAGKVVGCPTTTGLYVRLNGISYAVHRIVYVIMTGEELSSDDDIDHIDGQRFNNEWMNLRKATRSQNLCNKGPQCNNIIGYKSIGQLPSGKYRVRVSGIHIGCFDTISEAIVASNEATLKLQGEFGRLQ